MQFNIQKCGAGISYSGLIKLFFVHKEDDEMLFVALTVKIFKQICQVLDTLMWKTLLC